MHYCGTAGTTSGDVYCLRGPGAMSFAAFDVAVLIYNIDLGFCENY